MFVSHFRHSIEYFGIWTNSPNFLALLTKQMSYGHVALPYSFAERNVTFNSCPISDFDLSQYALKNCTHWTCCAAGFRPGFCPQRDKTRIHPFGHCVGYERLRWGCARGDLVLRFSREIAGSMSF